MVWLPKVTDRGVTAEAPVETPTRRNRSLAVAPMVCCQVRGVPHEPVAEAVVSGTMGFVLTSRMIVVVPDVLNPKVKPVGADPRVTPVMSTLPAPVTRLKLVLVFGVPVMFTVPFSDPLPPARITFVGSPPVAKLTVKEEPKARAKLWENTFPLPAKERLPPPPTLTAPLAFRLPLPPKETEPPLMATLPTLMLAPAVVEMLLPAPTVRVWPVALNPPEALKVMDPPLSVTGPPEFRSPEAGKVTAPPFTVSPPPGASVPVPARVSVAPVPTVTVPPVVNVFGPFRSSVPPVTLTAPLTSAPAPLSESPVSVRVPLPVFVRLAAVKGTLIVTFPLGVTVIPPVTVITRPPPRLMVAPEVMVSEFANPFPPLLMETVTAKGMVRSSAAVGTPAGFQFAAVFQAPLAALAQTRSTAWARVANQQHDRKRERNQSSHDFPLLSTSVPPPRKRRTAWREPRRTSSAIWIGKSRDTTEWSIEVQRR
jgi:hypothetical protein